MNCTMLMLKLITNITMEAVSKRKDDIMTLFYLNSRPKFRHPTTSYEEHILDMFNEDNKLIG